MKKFVIVLIAAIMAVGFSAFTPRTEVQDTYFLPRGGDWDEITAQQACTPGTQTACQVDNPFTPAFDPTTVYTSPVLHPDFILKKN